MTQALIQAYYDAFNAEDFDAMLALLTDDVAHDINQGARQEGIDAFRVFLAHMKHCYREQLTDLVILAAPDGTRAAAEFIVEGTYLQTDGSFPAASGQTYRLPAGAFFEVRDGRIARVTNYYNVKAWVAQVTPPA
jgi:steroid delta-isomerase-like uncharacterized protein